MGYIRGIFYGLYLAFMALLWLSLLVMVGALMVQTAHRGECVQEAPFHVLGTDGTYCARWEHE